MGILLRLKLERIGGYTGISGVLFSFAVDVSVNDCVNGTLVIDLVKRIDRAAVKTDQCALGGKIVKTGKLLSG